MERNQKILLGISGFFFILGFLFMLGIFTQPEVHLFTYEFDHDGFSQLDLRFESPTGVFTVGQKINVMAFLSLSTFDNQEDRIHLLYFPNSFTPEEYEKLRLRENFGKIVPDEDGSGFSFEVARSKILFNLGLFPPKVERSAVWTHDGPKNAILILDAERIDLSEKQLHEQGMVIENIITIQPSDVKVQMQSNNISIGLALVIVAVSTLTGFFSMKKVSDSKKNSNKKINDSQR